ncbi:hypothetical protein ACFSTC_32575 [Nonomuraea ferruginea]
MSGAIVSSAPSRCHITNVGMSVTAYGSMTPVSSSAKTTSRPRQRSREKLKAATEQVSTVPTTLTTAMTSVLTK